MRDTMKGISDVIAVILLLLVAIAIIGFAFGFFQRLATTSGQQTQQQLNSTANQIQTALGIDNVNGASLAIRNEGSVNLVPSTLSVYVNNVPTSCANANSWTSGGVTPAASIAPGASANCTLVAACPSGATIRVVAAGGSDSVICP